MNYVDGTPAEYNILGFVYLGGHYRTYRLLVSTSYQAKQENLPCKGGTQSGAPQRRIKNEK